MNPFFNFLATLSPLSDPLLKDLRELVQEKFYEKGALLLKSGQTCKSLFFINKGLVKMYFYKEDKQFIMRFFPEYSLLTGLDSFVTGKPSDYFIETLEPTSISAIKKTDLEDFCKIHPSMDTVLKNFFSMVSVNMMNRISEMLEEDATRRYNNFIEHQGELLQRISLGDLASYLGITQVSLSRIRAKM